MISKLISVYENFMYVSISWFSRQKKSMVWHSRAVSEHVHLQRANARLGVLIWHSRAVSEHFHWSVPKGNTPVLSKVLKC